MVSKMGVNIAVHSTKSNTGCFVISLEVSKYTGSSFKYTGDVNSELYLV